MEPRIGRTVSGLRPCAVHDGGRGAKAVIQDDPRLCVGRSGDCHIYSQTLIYLYSLPRVCLSVTNLNICFALGRATKGARDDVTEATRAKRIKFP